MRAVARLAVFLSAAFWLAPASAVAQPAPAKVEIAADGTDLFRALLDRKGIMPVKQKEMRNMRYDDVIVVVIGDQRFTNFGRPVDFARAAVSSGGAALVATDSSLDMGWSVIDGRGQASVVGAPVECTDADQVLAGRDPADPPDAAPKPRPNCPYAVPVFFDDPRAAPDRDSDIGKVFRGLNRVATNSPGYIRSDQLSGEFRFPLARFPADTFSFGARLRNAWFAIGGDGAGQFNNYQYLAMADHSVFINQMLLEPGTDNLELAYRSIEFLQGPNQRKRCLFIENGTVVENFDGLRKAFANQNPMPIPDLGAMQEKLVDLGNAIVDDIQTRDVPNTILTRTLGLPRILWALLILGAIYATVYLIRRWTGTRKPTDLPPPPTVAGAPTGPPGVFDRRQKELLRRDNVYEPIRDLVREFFVSLGIHGDQGPRHPKLVISDMVRKPDSLRQAVRDFWKLAYGPPQEVGLSRWRELEPYFVRLREAHADGKWRFVMPGAPVAASV
jgi:hypothetical protein